MPIRQRYVCGFLFDQGPRPVDRGVVLIRKERPDWQRGQLNGTGGKIRPGESSLDAMIREAGEGIGVQLSDAPRPWTLFARLTFTYAIVDFYFGVSRAAFLSAQARTDEQIERHKVAELPLHTLFNCRWLIPLALDFDRDYDDEMKFKIFTATLRGVASRIGA